MSGSSATTSVNLDLNTVTAAQAVKDSVQAAVARHTMRIHSATTTSTFSFTLDGMRRTDGSQADMISVITMDNKSDPRRGEVRNDGNAVYLDNPGLSVADRHGKTWVKLDLSHPPSAGSAEPGAALFASLSTVYAHDDPRQASLFLLAFPDLHRVGVETKDGRRALHVAGTVTPATLPAAPPAGSGLTRDYLDFRRQQMKDDTMAKISVDLWIGADGLPVESTEADSRQDGDTFAATTPSQWGASLTVAAPPAADTYAVPGA